MDTGERIHALRGTLHSPGWQDIIKPSVVAQIDMLSNCLINGNRAAGDERLSDDVLKGRIWAMVWMRDWDKKLQVIVDNFDAVQQQLATVEDHREDGL